MMRRFICCVAIAACTGVAAIVAAERATFVLVNGERKSGTLAAHGGNRENLIAGDLNLAQDNAPDISIHADQVALIELVGGRPPNNELQALPSGNSQAIVRRNGDVQRGRFVNIVNGDTLKWQQEGGNEETIPLSDVLRIYLRPDTVRQVFNVRGTRGAVATSGTSGTALEPGAVRVDANVPWVNSGIFVREGDMIAFRANGQIKYGSNEGQVATPAGDVNIRSNAYPVAGMPVGALIGRVGNGAPFAIGANAGAIRMPNSGQLMLGVNDNELADNSGFYSVVLTRP